MDRPLAGPDPDLPDTLFQPRWWRAWRSAADVTAAHRLLVGDRGR